MHRPIPQLADDLHKHQVAVPQKAVRCRKLRPRPILRRQHSPPLADLQRHPRRRHLRHQSMEVASWHHRLRPVRMPINRRVEPRQHYVLQVALPSMSALIRRCAIQHRLVRHALQIEVERRIHAQPRAVDRLHPILLLQLSPYLFDKVRSLAVRRSLDMQPQRRSLGHRSLRLGDLPIVQHLRQHQVPPPQRPIRIPQRRVILRPLRQRRQQSRLRQRQVLHMLVEIKLRPCLEPVRSMTQVDLIGIKRKDLVFREPALDLHRQEDLLELPPIRLLRRQEEVPRQLHRQRRCSLHPALRMQVAIRCAHRAKQIHTPVAFKALVFDRDDGLAQHRREIRIRHHHPPLQRKRAEDLAMNVVELGRRLRLIAHQVVYLRQVDRVHQHQPAHHPKQRRQREQ